MNEERKTLMKKQYVEIQIIRTRKQDWTYQQSCGVYKFYSKCFVGLIVFRLVDSSNSIRYSIAMCTIRNEIKLEQNSNLDKWNEFRLIMVDFHVVQQFFLHRFSVGCLLRWHLSPPIDRFGNIVRYAIELYFCRIRWLCHLNLFNSKSSRLPSGTFHHSNRLCQMRF